MTKAVGLTKGVGYQFGIRRTFAISVKDAWDFCFSDQGLKLWLGELETSFVMDKPFKTKSGITGIVRVLKPESHIRLNWKKENWSNQSLVQIRVIANLDKTTICIHQEKLIHSEQRDEMKVYWNEVMERISEELA